MFQYNLKEIDEFLTQVISSGDNYDEKLSN